MEQTQELGELSEPMQMYIKAVHEIQTRKGAARVTDIAEELDVRKASVTSALRTLSARDLVNYAPYDVVTLTDTGLAVAEVLDRRYRILRNFFVTVLGIDPDDADGHACELEHHMDDTLYERLVGFVEYYENCTTTKFRWDPKLGEFCHDPDA
jgi:DtxR family Mn-dependent transcriptional regulator